MKKARSVELKGTVMFAEGRRANLMEAAEAPYPGAAAAGESGDDDPVSRLLAAFDEIAEAAGEDSAGDVAALRDETVARLNRIFAGMEPGLAESLHESRPPSRFVEELRESGTDRVRPHRRSPSWPGRGYPPDAEAFAKGLR